MSADDRDPKRGSDVPEGALDGFRLEEPSSSDWKLQTTQRPLPKELLDAMKHPDMPGVVLEAIARRSSTPEPGDVESLKEPGEDTARYLLPPVAPKHVAAAQSQPRVAVEREEGLTQIYVLAFAFGGVVLAWLAFGLVGFFSP